MQWAKCNSELSCQGVVHILQHFSRHCVYKGHCPWCNCRKCFIINTIAPNIIKVCLTLFQVFKVRVIHVPYTLEAESVLSLLMQGAEGTLELPPGTEALIFTTVVYSEHKSRMHQQIIYIQYSACTSYIVVCTVGGYIHCSSRWFIKMLVCVGAL